MSPRFSLRVRGWRAAHRLPDASHRISGDHRMTLHKPVTATSWSSRCLQAYTSQPGFTQVTHTQDNIGVAQG